MRLRGDIQISPSVASNGLRECLTSGHFAVTAELTPPRGADLTPLTTAVRALAPAVSALNLTDGAGAKVRMASLAAAIHVKQLGVDPILQVTCRDRNRIAIQGDVLGAAAFGIENVLILTGDRIGDDDDAKPVFDVDSRAVVTALRTMSDEGVTMSGSELTAAPDFFRGVADMPIDPPASWAPEGLTAKLEAGAQFVQTQYCFDMELLGRYMQRLAAHGLTERLYVLVGLGPLPSAKRARWMRDALFGTIIPDGVIRRLEAARDPRHEGVRICAELMQQAREIDGVAGVHLMAPGRHDDVVEAIGLAG